MPIPLQITLVDFRDCKNLSYRLGVVHILCNNQRGGFLKKAYGRLRGGGGGGVDVDYVIKILIFPSTIIPIRQFKFHSISL